MKSQIYIKSSLLMASAEHVPLSLLFCFILLSSWKHPQRTLSLILQIKILTAALTAAQVFCQINF